MVKKYIIIRATDLVQLEQFVQSHMNAGAEIVGGPFSFAGMVCQAMMLNVEEETEHEDENIPG